MAERKVIGIIPAKARSRRIPGKNMRLFLGQPLLLHTIQRALESEELDEVIVSTDSEEIKVYCESLGVQAPFLRPPEHSRDDVHASVPILDMLERLGGTAAYSHCVPLMPTYPLRRTASIDGAVRLAQARGRNVLTVAPLGKVLHHLRTVSPDGLLNRVTAEAVINFQCGDAPELFAINGVAQCAPVEELLRHRTFQYGEPLGYVVDPIEATDIDAEHDWLIAERLADLVKMIEQARAQAA